MDLSGFGFWAMIMFWCSAIGGIVLAVNWAKRKGGNPVDNDILIKSLKQRYERGEISQKRFESELRKITDEKHQ